MGAGAAHSPRGSGPSRRPGRPRDRQAWVFLRSQQGWRNLIQEAAPLASGLGFEERVTNGLKNLVLVTNAGGQKDRYTRYRFNGQFYGAGDCFDAESPVSPTGEPKVTRVKCER